MHLITTSSKGKALRFFFYWFSSVKNSSPIHIFHRKIAWWHSHQCIKCFKFESTLAITLHQIMFEKSTFTYRCACQAKVVVSAESKLKSQIYRSYWNLEVFERVPRLESSYVFIRKLQPLYFVTCSFWRGLHCDWWNLCRAHFCEVPPQKNFFDGQNGIWQVLKTSILSTPWQSLLFV
jgi:hypothetical protein